MRQTESNGRLGRMSPGRLAIWLRHPQTTVRWRLTLLYGGLFLLSGVVLLAITYTLVAHATVTNSPFRAGPTFSVGHAGARPKQSEFRVTIPANVSATADSIKGNGSSDGLGSAKAVLTSGPVPNPVQRILRSRNGPAAILFVGSDQRISDLHQLIIESGIALAIMALISGALGWLVAGRVLRPVRTMTAAAQQISEASLHQRLALDGPPDELRQLADTIDGLLARLEGAFDAQRRFVANASHELRTPLTAARAMLEMVIADGWASVETFRATCTEVLAESERQEQLIDALLALAQGQRGIEHRECFDLAAIASEASRAHEPEAAARGLGLERSAQTAIVSGDRRLIERLVSNLLDNAIRHNVPDGTVRISVEPRATRATLSIANTGPVVLAEDVGRLLQPFQRLTADRVGHGDGLGLGLSIVAAIANAHDAGLELRPRVGGGLEVEVSFPRSPMPPTDAGTTPPRPVAAVGLTAAICALTLGACGSSGDPGRVSTSKAEQQALEFSNCMRAHGVSNFPDPGSGGQIELVPGVVQSPAFQGAQKACAKFQPGASGPPPQMTASQRARAFAFSRCMRSHGLPSFPDPSTSASASTSGPILTLRGMQFSVGPGLDPVSPAFRQAAAACGVRLPGKPPGSGTAKQPTQG